MRIIAGTRRGMKLLSPKTNQSRPITDRVKESLFDVLFNYGFPQGCRVADLFCGVGSLGLESLSRGAEFVTFVELDSGVAVILEQNIEKAQFVGKSKVVRADAFKIGATLGADGQKYGIVFIDPPYADTENVAEGSPLAQLLDILQSQVAERGIVTVRTYEKTSLLDRYGRFKVFEHRRWGTMNVTILQNVDE
jgi:16S rRNA (guanine(966)-N(2))-methyltransferase RsmD